MRILIFMFPFAGHIIPNQPLFLELSKRKAEVKVFGCDSTKYGSQEGIEYQSYPQYIMEICKVETNVSLSRKEAANHYYANICNEVLVQNREYMLYEIGHRFCMQYIKELKKWNPDYIFYDSNVVFLKEMLSQLKVKCIELNASTWNPDRLEKSRSWNDFLNQIVISETNKEVSVEKIAMIVKKNIRLQKKLAYAYHIDEFECQYFAYHCEELQDEVELLPKENQYLGFDLKMNHQVEKDGSIYISRGTMSDLYGVYILQETIEALTELELPMRISLGNNKKAKEIICSKEYPSNMKIELYTNQLECLGKAKLFITHGGITGVKEAIMNQTPMIVIPTNFPDYQVGKALEKAHAGFLIESRPLDRQEIMQKVKLILDNYKSYQSGIYNLENALQKKWRQFGIAGLLDELEQSYRKNEF